MLVSQRVMKLPPLPPPPQALMLKNKIMKETPPVAWKQPSYPTYFIHPHHLHCHQA